MDISKSIDKVDNHIKMSGVAKYTSDYYENEMLYALTIRSEIAFGNLIKITYPTLPEGYYVIDKSDVPGKNIVKIIFDDMPIFADKQVTYIGEPIALIIGPNKAKVDELVKETKIVYEELEPCFEWTKSGVHYDFHKGDINLVNQDERIIEYDYQTGYQEQAYIEPQGFYGYYEENKVTLVGSIQCPYYVKNAVLMALDKQPNEVRVIQANVGGAFGGKEEFPSLIGCQLAVAIEKIKKPIKLIYERMEDMISTTKRHPSKTHLKAYINKKNRITKLEVTIGIDGGANIGLSGVVLSRALIASTGAYTIPNIHCVGDVFITNTVPNGAFRGFGAPQMLFAIESFMEHIALDLNIDPLTFRFNHLAKQHDFTSTGGVFRDPIIMNEMIEKAMAVSSYQEKWALYQNNPLNKGIGMSWFLHGCGFTGSGESTHIHAKVKLEKNEEDVVSILIAAVDMGQGVKTTMRKLVSQILNKPIEQVIFDNPDTDFVPDSGPTVASRTMMIVGGLVSRAAKRLKEEWVNGKKQLIEENYQQPQYMKWDESSFTGDAYPAYSWGVNIVEVSVNPVTYEVTIDNITSVYDLGKAIDERIVHGQADGGIVQGVSYGYLEVMNHKNGKLEQKNFTDYIIPTASDIGKMETFIIDNPYPLGPYGAKGVGELTLVGGAPAVSKAIQQAIKRKVFEIPMTPEKIMELIINE